MESQANERVYAELVSGLLGARSDPATDRFDEELDRAVADGEVSAAAARRLWFWQRASLRALTDHTRTVLPITLGALEASRRDAESYLDGLDGLGGPEAPPAPQAPQAPQAPEEAPEADTPAPPTTITLPGPIRLEGSAPRLLVAGLVTTTASDIHLENR